MAAVATANPSFGTRGARRPATGQVSEGLAYKWAVLLCLMPALTVFMIDFTVVNVALAKLGAVFGVDVAVVGWAVTAFALASGVVTPMASFLERRFGMKRVWIAALLIFTGGSLLCGIAPSFWVLAFGRLLQGVGGGLLLPITMGALFRYFPEGERGMAMGLLAIPLVAGPAFGPTIGGYIITYLDWRLVFIVNLPIGALAVTMAAMLLRWSPPETGVRFDTVGAVLSSLGFGGCLYGIARVSQEGWGSPTVQGVLGVGLVSLAAFIVYEATHDDPLLDVKLFLLPQFLIGNVVNWVGNIALFGAEFMLPLYLQNLRGLTALDAGLLLLPQGLAVALSGPIAGKLLDRIGARPIAMLGFVLLAVNTWELSHITMQTSFGELRWLLVARGIALGFGLAPGKLVALAAAPERLRTNASSLVNGMQSVIMSFGVALLATMVQTQTVVHAAVLGWQVRAETMPGVALGQLSGLLQLYSGLPAAGANLVAVAAMAGQVQRQAAVLAFGDAYRLTFFAALAACCLAALLPGRRAAAETGSTGGAMAVGH